ncbi:hypothetical protein [Methanoregula sp.]|uniref:hypothetical protein n=1 Tax=Methanoregula sp. TaxID=2052170 RepID=UPI003564B05A
MVTMYTNAAGLAPTTDPMSMMFIVFMVALIFTMVAATWWIRRRNYHQQFSRK